MKEVEYKIPGKEERVVAHLYVCTLCHSEMWLTDREFRAAERTHHGSLVDLGKDAFVPAGSNHTVVKKCVEYHCDENEIEASR
jgi:hypothetical protein